MSHRRTLIRNALVTMLTGTTNAEGRVEANRTNNLNKSPSIVIYDEQEQSTTIGFQGRRTNRTIEMKIELTVKGTNEVDTELDDLAEQVENVILNNPSILGTASSSLYVSTEKDFEQADQKIGRATLTYSITYMT